MFMQKRTNTTTMPLCTELLRRAPKSAQRPRSLRFLKNAGISIAESREPGSDTSSGAGDTDLGAGIAGAAAAGSARFSP